MLLLMDTNVPTLFPGNGVFEDGCEGNSLLAVYIRSRGVASYSDNIYRYNLRKPTSQHIFGCFSQFGFFRIGNISPGIVKISSVD